MYAYGNDSPSHSPVLPVPCRGVQVCIHSYCGGRGLLPQLCRFLLTYSTNFLASFPGLPRFFCSSVCVDNNTRMLFRRPSASVYYCQRKPKNRKNGVGLGTRLPISVCYRKASCPQAACVRSCDVIHVPSQRVCHNCCDSRFRTLRCITLWVLQVSLDIPLNFRAQKGIFRNSSKREHLLNLSPCCQHT